MRSLNYRYYKSMTFETNFQLFVLIMKKKRNNEENNVLYIDSVFVVEEMFTYLFLVVNVQVVLVECVQCTLIFVRALEFCESFFESFYRVLQI